MNLSICLRAPLLAASLLGLAAITALPPLAAAASPREPMPAMGRMQAPHMEPQREPRGYTRFRPPPAIERRPPSIDRGYYGHHFQADRAYRIGPYHAPPNFVYRRWVIGAILPPLFWGATTGSPTTGCSASTFRQSATNGSAMDRMRC